jgi:Rieske [2Fe-2S] domain
MERVDRLTTAVVQGRFYLVPTVWGEWNGRLANWPVIGPLHEDREFFNFTVEHYHIDPRFVRLSPENRELTFARPLHAHPRGEPNVTLPAPIFHRKKCLHSWILYPYYGRVPIDQIQRHFAGTQCLSGKGGWICPHRKASLGSIVPVDGVITCPLHGIKIDAATGKVLALAGEE